ncbi:AEC family transporter [Marinomonas sp. TW1]|uniref:AEC family transporter n=1 Tax=Marinomonas sp. TW1 TaxID=1561203 RepID=UPI0007AF161B|nr:AEC family transporter [Marinomonas sp. TW1]KZN13980.1 hypothetical protein OA79_07800 [Marinomonas sp. TW1]
MIDIFLKLLPFFSLVLIGYLFKSKFSFANGFVKYLTRFVLYLSLPAVLLGKISITDYNALVDSSFLLAYLLSITTVMMVSVLICYLCFSKGMKYSLMLGLGGVYGNVGFLAIPVLTVIIGEWVSVPLALILTLDLLILLPVTTFLLQLNSTNSLNNITYTQAFKRSFINPLILSILIGGILSFFQIRLPGVLIHSLDWVGSAAGPCAMFIVGTALYGKDINKKPIAAVSMSVLKLIVTPSIVYLFMSWFSVDREWTIVATLGAAMPCAAVLGVIAAEHKVLVQQASTAVLITTVFSVITIPLLIFTLI